MTTEVVLRADTISKKFSTGTRRAMYHATADIARELAWWRTIPAATRPGEFWALKDVSLELARGKAVAIIGANGAGKSTLLKLLSGLLKPDTGRVVVRGRLRAMIELGAGFAPSLSGRDNVYAQASLYGYRRRDLKSNLESIVEFSGLESFIDAPVQQYSDGMRARLGFAIAIHLDPDLLLVDEVLAVGDIAFQNKCIAHIRRFILGGGALAFVGHGTHQIQAVCDYGMVLVKGEMKFAGTAVDATDYYLRTTAASSASRGSFGVADASERPSSSLSIDKVDITKVGDGPLVRGSTLRISAVCTARESAENLGLGFTVYSASTGVCVGGGLASPAVKLAAGTHTLSCLVFESPLLPGDYLLVVYLFDHAINYPAAVSGWEDGAHHITVESDPTAMANLARIAGMPVGIRCVWEQSQP